MNNSIQFIFVNYYSEKYIVDCITSLFTHYKNQSKKLTIVDNSPTDQDLKTVIEEDIEIIKSNSNLGFAKANNLGAQRSDSKFICFVNPDTLFVEDCISTIINYMESDDDIGICGPMLVYEDLKYQSSTGFKMGFWFEFFEASMLMRLYRNIRGKSLQAKIKSSRPVIVDWLSGAFMIVKRNVFDEVNGFSNDYFLNYEDIDFCRKVQLKGYKNLYFPALRCIHFDHGSFSGADELLVYTRYQSKLVYSRMHYNPVIAALVHIVNIIGIILRIFGTFIYYRQAARPQRLRGYMHSFKLYLGLEHN